VGFLAFFQTLALMPTPLERPLSVSYIEPDTLKPRSEESTLAPGIPRDQIPEYTVDQFEFVSTQAGERQWKMVAEKAHMFNSLSVMHARQVVVYLYNPDSEPTVVTGLEAKYFLDDRDLEVFGKVRTQFPDGFSTYSEYMRYRPGPRRVLIPESYLVQGRTDESDSSDQTLDFDSMGMDYPMNENQVYLPKQVKAIMRQGKSKTSSNQGVESVTEIRSDQCVINRTTSIAHFSMYPGRPAQSRFVRITQPDLYARSRKADLRFGSFKDVLHYLTAFEDVFIQETDPEAEGLQYATGGQADFDSKKKIILLTEFPQVYQDDDTLVGDVILMHRETGIVEVDYGNAYTTGKTDEPTE
jgi:LPS export ABC transporter protein LptC